MASGGSEVPQQRVAGAREQREARVLVARPFADVRARHVADVVGVKQEQRAKIGGLQLSPCALQAIAAELREVDALLPIDRHGRAARRDVSHLDSLRDRTVSVQRQ